MTATGILPDRQVLTEQKRGDDAPLFVLAMPSGGWAVQRAPGSPRGERVVQITAEILGCTCTADRMGARCEHMAAVQSFKRERGARPQLDLDDGTMPVLLDDEGATARDDRFAAGEYTDPADLFKRSDLERVGFGR